MSKITPQIVCRELPVFTTEKLEDVRHAFRHTTSCALQQAWMEQPEADFAPAIVRTGVRGETFLVFAELSDADIYSHATGLNQRAWELGDSFEIFLRPVEQDAYVEYQVTPNNQRLQLRYAHAAALDHARKTGSMEHALIPGEAFRSTVWLRPEAKQWFVLAEIPAKSVCDVVQPLKGNQWRFSFSRYDYTRGRQEPVISSTSPFTKADFHRQEEWGLLTFS